MRARALGSIGTILMIVVIVGGIGSTPAEGQNQTGTVIVSFTSSGTVGGIAYRDEDVLTNDVATGAWDLMFDGSDVGLRFNDVDGVAVLDDGDPETLDALLLSLTHPQHLPGLGWVDDSDLLEFTPTALGPDTAGSFSIHLDGSTVGLTRFSEDVNSVAVTDDGRLVVSTLGSASVPRTGGGVLRTKDEDLLVLNPTGDWELYFDGSGAGLRGRTEGLWGASIDPATGDIALTTAGRFDVPGLSGDRDDLIEYDAATQAFSLLLDGDVAGFGRARPNAVAAQPAPPAIGCTIDGIAVSTDLDASECDALVAFYDSTAGPSWIDNSGWRTTSDPCGWVGVTCTGGRVSGILLLNNGLTGPLPSEIGDLDGLVSLQLFDNAISGVLPTTIDRLTSLQTLNLQRNDLSGPLPDEIGDMTSLTLLRFSGNQVTGPIPATIGDLTALEDLWAFGNQLTGPIPPEIGNLASLRELRLDDNQLSGPLPTTIGGLVSLQTWTMSGNQISGTFPASIGNLASLQELRHENNLITGPIPAEFGDLAALRIWYFRNNQVSGALPPEIGDLAALEQLWGAFNQISGPLPSTIGGMTALNTLWLDGNLITGGLPAEVGDMTSMQLLWLAGNQMSGPLPAEIGDLAQLASFRFNDNDFSGPIPVEIGNLSSLVTLDGVRNQLTGPVPSTVGGLAAIELLHLNQNQLSGVVPPAIAGLTTLTSLNLFGNGCLTADPATATFLVGFDPNWDNGCP